MSSRRVIPIVLAAVCWGFTSLPTKAASIPTVTVQQGERSATAPNWEALTFAKLPRLQTSGAVGLRSWRTGQPLDQVLTLSDFEHNFRLQDLNLFTIAVGTQVSPEAVKLSQFKLFERQTLADLVGAIPKLGTQPIAKVPLLKDRLSVVFPRPNLARTLNEIITSDPQLGTVNFINFDLSRYTLKDVPGLLSVPLQRFQFWQTARMSDVPGLKELPWSFFPVPPQSSGSVGIMKLTGKLGVNSLSGSDIAGYRVPCNTITCSGIQLSGDQAIHRKVWLTGRQLVQGGQGEGAQLSNGLEPTGRNIFSNAFKVVLTEASQQSIKTALYFRACQLSSSIEPNCSPFVIGPVPFISYRPGDGIVVGDIEDDTETAEVKQVHGFAVTARVAQPLKPETPQEPVPIIEPDDPRETLQEKLLALTEGLRQWLKTVFPDLTA
ncbi:hypothetical protein AB3R30_20875 [Leptolyngbyaceae cyanobacterium UHCC 1019]